MMRSILIGLGLLLAAAPLGYCQESKQRLQLQSPVEIENIVTFLDGGTVGIRVKDSVGKILELCMDHRLEVSPPYHIYIGGTHPTSPGALKLNIGSEEEEAVLRLLEEGMTRMEQRNVDAKEAETSADSRRLLGEVIDTLKNR